MPRTKLQNNLCLILRRARTGEYDLLITGFTLERGKIRAMAKNAGRPGSTRAPHLEPITVSTLQLNATDQLDFITQAVTNDSMAAVKSNLETMAQAHCVAETIDALTEERDPYPELFSLAVDTIKGLPESAPGDVLLRYFEYHALRINGTQPELHYCVQCMEPIQENRHRYSPQMGGTLCDRCYPDQGTIKPLSLRALKVLRLFQTGDMERAKALQLNPLLAKELKDLMSLTVSYNASKEIRSSVFLDAIRRNQPRAYRN